jgi:uncharacterized membrane protein
MPSDILGFATMRWLMIGFLVSLGLLLLAAVGGACHIWLQRAKLARKPPRSADLGAADGADIEVES